MKEFAKNGYKKASTDIIVKEAEISKGALFHYFKNKKELFLFLYDYSLDTVKNGIFTKINYEEKDIFIRRRQTALLKIEVLKKYPEMYNFLGNAYLETAEEVKGELAERNKKLMAEGQKMIHEGIDTSKFREGVDICKAIEIINWTAEGFSNKAMAKVKSFDLYEKNFSEVLEELDIYMDILKKSFYK